MENGFQNLDVSSTTDVIVNAGEEPASFDELEAAMSAPPQKKERKSLDETESKPAGKKEGSDKEKTPKKKADGESDETESSDEKKATPPADAKYKKSVKVKLGESDVDLPLETMVPATVDGKTEMVRIGDLVAEYSGKTIYTKKFSELDRERKTFQSEKEGMLSQVKKIHQMVATEKKPIEALRHLAELMGADPIETVRSLRRTMREAFPANMSDEDVAAQETKEELEYYRSRDAESKVNAETQKVDNNLKSRMGAIRERHKITDEQFVDAYLELTKEMSQEERAAVEPEDVDEYISSKSAKGAIESLLKENSPDIENVEQTVKELLAIQKKNDLDMEDMKEVISQTYGKNKVSKGFLKKLQSQSSSPSKGEKHNNERAMLFEDLDD